MNNATACINIGPAQTARRLRFGLIAFLVTDAIAAALIVMHAPRVARLGLALPLFVAAVGVFQARERTCVSLAARGLRNMDGGDEPITDDTEREALKQRANRIYLLSIVCAALMTAAFFFLPI